MAKLTVIALLAGIVGTIATGSALCLVISVVAILVEKASDVLNKDQEETLSESSALILFRDMKYSYLKSSVWDEKRRKVLYRDANTCQCCGAKNKPLHVHHMSGYGEIPHEGLHNLISLCEECHDAQHDLHGFPSTLEEYHAWNHQI